MKLQELLAGHGINLERTKLIRHTSALDPELTGEVLSVMRKLADEGMTMLVVTHEMGFAKNVSNKVVFMENGLVVESGDSKSFFAHPKEERTRNFIRTILGEDAGIEETCWQKASCFA